MSTAAAAAPAVLSAQADVTDICCIGAGYVGAITMTIIAQHCPEIKIVVVDVNQAKIDQWNSDDLPLFEPGLKEIIMSCRDKNLFFSTDVDGSIRKAQMIFIAVDTNTKKYGTGSGSAYDLTATETVARKIAHVAQSSKIVVEKSTVPVRTCERISAILNENKTDGDIRFEVLSNPEFLAEGEAVRNLREPSRIVIGCRESPEGYHAANALCSVYRHWVPAERIVTTKSFSAELAKVASNAFLAQRISSINAISSVCEATGADINEVAKAIGMDPRLGPRFLQTSLGFGGSCFKKDLMALVYLCEYYQLTEVATYWRQVILMNEHQKHRFAKQIYDVMNGTLANKRIVLFGFAFKKNTEDIRESPAIDVARVLLDERAEVVVYDPKVHLQTIHQLGEPFGRVIQAHDPYAACARAHAVVVVTEWDEFVSFDYKRIFESMVRPAYIFDGRNILQHDELQKIGFRVYAIGRPHNRHAH